ncbi:hypothetical protein [uncultured Sphingorhabdus sp.]|uniref:hypothetical protein n=1 Tax=uncultured Sphingorhabdus sp. TaxID=1686106 RepID=UPI00260B9033|nr:hypothetical protein [uncultured Sphingorhabdus sp.]HMS20081.1 hypothetical protein [Sphingorhabdus sp.]
MQTDDVGNSGLMAPNVSLDIGITGHRSHHPVFSANSSAIAQSLVELVTFLDVTARQTTGVSDNPDPLVRLHSLLAYGADLMAVKTATAIGWPVIAPLPFGRALNLAVNAQPTRLDDMRALLTGQDPADQLTFQRAAEIRSSEYEVSLFELAEQDGAVEALFSAHLANPDDNAAEQAFFALCSDRAAMAARVMIEQSDIVIGIWDGVTHGSIGGTRHTIEAALDQGVPVIWIDARDPHGWHLLQAKEELAALTDQATGVRDEAGIDALIRVALCPSGDGWKSISRNEKWRDKSNPLLHAYRRIEALFGDPSNRPFRNITQRYERPDAIAAGSGAAILAAAGKLDGIDPVMPVRIADEVMRPFAWADGVSTWLSDAYRGSMVASFFLSAFAIVGGIAYLPFASIEQKWWFAAFEFILLFAIIGIFFTGKRKRWHERWFEIRRVAEYFRHAPILLLVGAARPIGRWPRGSGGNWPEWYARHALRNIGLPQIKVTSAFLKGALALMRDHHVGPQRDYHRAKALRLKRAQHNLDRLSEILFLFAVASVALYLVIELGAAIGWLPGGLPHDTAKLFTFLGVLFPTMGGAFAGVHYFGDFERFAAISEITAEKLDDIASRIAILESAPDGEITYARVSGLAHAIDDIVVDEIENWQSVFAGKRITVPV